MKTIFLLIFLLVVSTSNAQSHWKYVIKNDYTAKIKKISIIKKFRIERNTKKAFRRKRKQHE